MPPVTAGLLDIDAGWAAREVAIGLVAGVSATIPRLDDPADDEAIHAFRVATRRARSWLRAFRPWIESEALRREERRVRDLARQSSGLRDLEVQVALLEQLCGTLPVRSQQSLRSAINDLRTRQNAAAPEVRRAIRRRFPRTETRLLRALGRVDMEIDPRSWGDRRLRFVLAELAVSQAAIQRAAMDELRYRRDAETVHRARIAGKRLRYLLEPLAAVLAVGAMLAELKSLQDTLGEVHDAHVLRATLESMRTRTRTQRAAVASVIGALDLRAEDLLATVVANEELPDRATSTAAEAVADVAAVPGIASQVEALATILRAPQRLEIERKYLLSGLPPEVASAPVDTIDQGYIPGREIAERLRRARRGRAARFYRTIKTGRGIARIETEEEIDGALFRRLWPATAGKRVAKRRYHVADGERVWEVDAFTDRELVLAEVELQSESEAVEIPAWLSPWVVREVTGEDEYMNLNLAR